LLNDLGREPVFDDIIAWIDGRIPAKQEAELPAPTVLA